MKDLILAGFADEAGASVEEQIAALKENGLTHLEVRGVEGKNITTLTTQEAKALRERLDAAGIGVWSIGSPLGKIKITDDFAPHLETFRHTLELAKILGADRIRMFSFFIPKGEAPRYRDEVFARLEAFCAAARGTGITLCHENEKEIYGDTAERCLDIHQNFPELKAVFDPANFLQCGVDTVKAFALLKPYLDYFHIKDVKADGTVVPAGAGEGHVPELVKEYLEMGGKALTVEPHLAVFKGFAELENGQKTQMGAFEYESSRAAFDAAAKAMKALL